MDGEPCATGSREPSRWKLPDPWPQLLSEGQLFTGLLLSTSFSEKYGGRTMKDGEVAEIRLPIGHARDASNKETNLTWRPKLLHRVETAAREAVAFLWLGDDAVQDHTVYVAITPMRRKRQFYKIWKAPLVEDGINATGKTLEQHRILVSAYSRRLMFKLQALGLKDRFAEVVSKYPNHRFLFAGISHGAALAQIMSFQFALAFPKADTFAATWNGYRWTDEAGSVLVANVLGSRLLPMVMSRQNKDNTREWDSVAGYPPDFATMPGIVMLDADDGSFLPFRSNNGSDRMEGAHLGANFAWRMMELHFAKAAIKATRAAMSNSFGGRNGNGAAIDCDSPLDFEQDKKQDDDEEDVDEDQRVDAPDAAELRRDSAALERRSVQCAEICRFEEILRSHTWVGASTGVVLPGRAVYAGNTEWDGVVYVARHKAGEAAKVNLSTGKGPRRLFNVWAPFSGHSEFCDILLVNEHFAATWQAVSRGGSVPDGAVLSGKTLTGAEMYVARSLKGEAGMALCTSGRTVLDIVCHSDGSVDQGEMLVLVRAEGDLHISIDKSEGLKDPAYRLGDLTGSLIGAKVLKPYVQVSYGEYSWQTGYREEPSGQASFGESTTFPITSLLAADHQVRFRVLDRRLRQGWVGGDALIGEGTLSLGLGGSNSGDTVKVEMLRDGVSHGFLHVSTRTTWRSEPQPPAPESVEAPVDNPE